MRARRAIRRILAVVRLSGSLAVAGGSVSSGASDLGGWTLLPPLPDPIGFVGMFAGVLNGRLVAGGGSQFPDRPLWLNGEKVFSDRIFTLAAPDAKWTEHSARLPVAMGSSATAAGSEAIYIAGGLNAGGCLRQAWVLRAEGSALRVAALPDLPRPVGYGTAAIVAGRLYVVGGLDSPASKIPLAEVWSLDLDAARTRSGWRREPDLPGPGVYVAAAASDDRHLYVLGGSGFAGDGKRILSNRAYRLSVRHAKWEVLPPMPEPRVGAASPCPVVPGGRLFLIGGYAEVFPGAPRDHPGFSAQTLHFDLAGQRWENGPVLPTSEVVNRDSPSDAGPAPMIGAPCVRWNDLIVVVSGEVRSSVRTPAVLAWRLRADSSSR